MGLFDRWNRESGWALLSLGRVGILVVPRAYSQVLSRKKKILKHFWAEKTEKIVIWPQYEKTSAATLKNKSEKRVPRFQLFASSVVPLFSNETARNITFSP